MTLEHRHGGGSGWLQHTLEGIAGLIEQAVFTEEHSHKPGWLQGVDPRAKLVMFVIMALAVGLTRSLMVLLPLYGVVLAAAWASRVPFDFFVKRVWVGIPFFAGIVILPSIFFVAGDRLFDLPLGPLHIAPSLPGLGSAAVFVVRVAVSVSTAVLLVLTTPWADILKSLQVLRAPQVFILILSMSYRYIFLFLHTATGMMEARKSRSVGHTSGGEQRRWIAGTMGALMNRSFKMSTDVYAAMMARGFTGRVHTYVTYRMTSHDWVAVAGALAVAVTATAAGALV